MFGGARVSACLPAYRTYYTDHYTKLEIMENNTKYYRTNREYFYFHRKAVGNQHFCTEFVLCCTVEVSQSLPEVPVTLLCGPCTRTLCLFRSLAVFALHCPVLSYAVLCDIVVEQYEPLEFSAACLRKQRPGMLRLYLDRWLDRVGGRQNPSAYIVPLCVYVYVSSER